MTMTAETVAGDGPPTAGFQADPGAVTVLTAGTGPVTVRVFPGLREQAGEARRWVCATAAARGLPGPDELALITTELFANAVLHTRSGGPGGKVTVAVTADGVIHIHDHGPAGPCPGLAASSPSDEAPGGRGLEIVTALSAGLAHLPAAWCPAAGPDDPAAMAGGCCTCCRPAGLPASVVPAARGAQPPAVSVTRESSATR